jgi:hypothetical protein
MLNSLLSLPAAAGEYFRSLDLTPLFGALHSYFLIFSSFMGSGVG